MVIGSHSPVIRLLIAATSLMAVGFGFIIIGDLAAPSFPYVPSVLVYVFAWVGAPFFLRRRAGRPPTAFWWGLGAATYVVLAPLMTLIDLVAAPQDFGVLLIGYFLAGMLLVPAVVLGGMLIANQRLAATD